MTEAEWLTSEDPTAMLRFLTGSASGRKLRLFATACCRRVQQSGRIWSAFTDPEFYVSALERHADGLCRPDEWTAVVQKMRDDAYEITDRTLDVLEADFCTFLCAITNDAPEAALWAAVNANIVLSSFPRRPEPDEVAGSAESCVQTPILRDIFGNPSRPIAFDSAWRTSTVVALAAQMYENRDFSAMPILADALQDAGCENPAVLDHCRNEKQVHVRGCWVCDTALGRE